MAKATIKTLYSDREKTEILYPRTKVGAISDNDGIGLEAILDHMVYSSDVKIESVKASDPINADTLGGEAPGFYATKNYVKEEVVDVINENLVNNYLKKEIIEEIYAPKSYVDDKIADIIGGGDIVLDGYVTDLELQDKVQELQTDVLEAKTNAVNEAQTYTNQQVKKAAPRNLLDNSDFRNPVNQRELINYDSTGYTIDRWGFYESVEAVLQVQRKADGMPDDRIAILVGAGYVDFYQHLENYEQMAGKTYTFAVNIEGTVHTCTFKMGQGSGGYPMGNDGAVFYSLPNVPIMIRATASPGFNMYWAALYEGEYTTETLPEYQSKGYETELLICRQYDPSTGEYIGLRNFGFAHNLLDNSDFRNPVNQRGYSNDSVPNWQMFIDRWLAYDHSNTNSALNVTLSKNGLVLNPSEASLTQHFPDSTRYYGKTLTVGVGFADGTVYAYSGIVPNGEWATIVQAENDNFWLFCQTFNGDKGILSLQPKQNITISWIALYEGEYTAETLPEYQPKGYENELLVCRQYDPSTDEYIGLRNFGFAHNLLDNSDFRNPVNQRGLEGYSGNNVYTIDRWVITSDNGKACGFVVDNGYLINLNGATLATLTQRIVGLDQNKRYTFAYEDADGNIHIQNPADIIWGDNYAYARIIAMANTTVKWAALYEGEYTAETLPEYQPKGYGAELAECQRYANVLEVSVYGRVGLCDVEEGASNGLLMVNTNQMRQGVVPSVSLISGNWTDLKLRNSSISVTSMTGFGYQVGTTHPFLVSLDGVNPSTRIEPILNTSANVVKILISLDL